ncbi:MAG: tail fiber domain-containing protein, partial [Anaerolineales bacterium]|nr:tail fiber domain-containing protein [Anaerolineales bacterium]
LNQLRPVQFKWKDQTITRTRTYEEGDDIPDGKEVDDTYEVEEELSYSRTHYGLIAQEVEQVLEDNEISTNDFAPFIKSPILDGDTEGEPTGDHFYGMRYGEYVGILIKAVQELSAKNEELSAKVEALENA